jgi:TrmH family RNA methyltransferase
MSITFVLEHTSHPGNIGGVARAMHTMGLAELILINPCEITDEAYLRARHAKSVIENAKVYQDISVLDGFNVLYGTTSRHRSLHLPVYSSRIIAPILLPESKVQKVAILFGNEKHGLSNELLNLCQAVIEIPAIAGHSLNLSHAVQLIAYELNQSIETESKIYSSVQEREQFIQWLENYHQDNQFLLPHTISRIRSIINKAKLTSTEVKLLYSLISKSK